MDTNLTPASAAPRRSMTALMFEQLRPKQWTKNVLVFAALLFSIGNVTAEHAALALAAFAIFCLVSSCVYILNDYLDLEADRSHPEKKRRPMASGRLPVPLALTVGALLLLASLAASFGLGPAFGGLVAGYFLLNACYSIRLKHVVILDIMTIAAGFVLRAIGGGLVIGVPFTPWFLLCILLLALFLAIGKRRHELVLWEESGSHAHRKVLKSYSLPLLDQMNNIVTSATVLCYALFTFTSGNSVHLMWTIPLVVYGIFRYMYLIHVEKKGGSPDRLLFEDKHILVTVVLYTILTVAILYIAGERS